jgi:triacylglycerol esterase/lipase EstA (alpha/beta hydrolase family)
MRVFIALLISAGWLCAQSSPRTPVVLVDGYHLFCDSSFSTSAGDFANMEQYLRAESVPVYFFGTCSQSGKPRIEKLAIALDQFIRSTGAPQVDLVTFSMGGLVARAYLSGKQPTDSNVPPAFVPPVPRVRRFIAIASPNFGALFPGALSFLAPGTTTTTTSARPMRWPSSETTAAPSSDRI